MSHVASAKQAADELRRFRHFLRHAYGAPLDFDRLRTLASSWRDTEPALEADLEQFDAFLEQVYRRSTQSYGRDG